MALIDYVDKNYPLVVGFCYGIAGVILIGITGGTIAWVCRKPEDDGDFDTSSSDEE